jgi:hypothetical protein
MWILIASISSIIIISALIGAYIQYLYKLFAKPKPIDYLKNALLSYLLMKCGNIESGPGYTMNYKTSEKCGHITMLPSFSGCSMENACFTYIQTTYDQVFGPFPSNTMNYKQSLINKYIKQNLNTETDIVNIFSKFIEVTTCDLSQDKTK